MSLTDATVSILTLHRENVLERMPPHAAPERGQRLLDFVDEVRVERHVENLLRAVLLEKDPGKPCRYVRIRENPGLIPNV